MKNLKYDSDKVNDYSKKELAEMIFNGEVSREQVNEDGLYLYHRPMLDKELSLMEQEEHDWTEATNHNTVGSFQVYLDKYNPTIVEGETITDGWVENTVYVGRHVDDAIRLQTVEKIDGAVKEDDRDKAAWNKAEEGNSIESYNEYITVYDKRPPAYRGQYVDEAKLRIRELQDKFDWDKAVSENTIESYKTYLSKYDVSTSSYRGAYISEAVEAIKRLTLQSMPHTYPVDPLKNETEDWGKAVRADNIEAYKCYLSKYELLGGKYVVDAKNAIERLLEEKVWSEALNNDNFVGYKKYINIYQNKNSKHLVEAEQKLNQLKKDLALIIDNITPETTDDKEWGKACKANTIIAYRLYLSNFDGQNTSQKGKYVDEANKRINSLMDEACWADAVKQDTREAYQNYLKQYPNGHHCDEVKRILNPISKSAGCLKPLLWCCLFLACAFLSWQYFHKEEAKPDQSDAIEIDSLQWAIDNHDIPMLRRYANMDSVRAYYHLSKELWHQQKDTLNSMKFIREAFNYVKPNDPLYTRINSHFDVLKVALDYDNTIGHVAPPLSSNIEERLLILSRERAIIRRAKAIAERYSFEYTPDKKILQYIEDDFNRWVQAGDDASIRATKEDCYKSALQLKEDRSVREKLVNLYK